MTDERLCATCSHTSHSGLPCSAYTSGLRSCPCSGESQAAPSTDEEEARWLRDALDGLAENFCRQTPPCEECNAHVERVAAAIRAPLEERIERMERMLWDARMVGQVAEERIRDLQAENARLREALERSVRNYHAVWCAALPGPMALDWRKCVSPECAIVRALATPPSSTEGTKEVGG